MDGASVVAGEANGTREARPNRRSSTVYAVTSGRVSFDIAGQKSEAAAGDLVVRPPGTRRSMMGTAVMLIISTPPFDPADESP